MNYTAKGYNNLHWVLLLNDDRMELMKRAIDRREVNETKR